MIVIFVHGWSVTDTNTYGLLPEAIAKQSADYGLTVDIKHVWLGRYISFDDAVDMGDITRAFDSALRDTIPQGDGIEAFSCITHSTGGPVVREWLDRYYGSEELAQSPLNHLVMLAPANHGSPLAALGKQRVGRIKAWFNDIEPGQQVLDWLSLGSQPQIDLAKAYLTYQPASNGFYPFVLTGESIDKAFYDFINSYLTEPGSDGVVRVSGANMNYSIAKFVETEERAEVKHAEDDLPVSLLSLEGAVQRPQAVPLGVVPKASHSGKSKGIMRSVLSPTSSKPQVSEILQCLKVNSAQDYQARVQSLETLTATTQQRTKRFINLVFVLTDDQGHAVTDYDVIFLAGPDRDPKGFKKGFFLDKQKNAANPNHIVFYVNYDVIAKTNLTGFRVIARPSEGFSFYHAVEYRVESSVVDSFLHPNETLYIEVELRRRVDQGVFFFDEASDPKLRKEGVIFKSETRYDFTHQKPTGKEVK
ncbi:esterase/lipase family protein [Vibrio chaetopteri]|uniref:esterase/lipase family protein n=1 Tax=Vibrio chaetopteri TaxID=3016528 RepID=UPI003AB38567